MAWEEDKYQRIFKLLEQTYKDLKVSYETQQGIIGSLELLAGEKLEEEELKDLKNEDSKFIKEEFLKIINFGMEIK